MGEKIYGYAGLNWRNAHTAETYIRQTLDIGGHGIYCIDKNPDAVLADFAAKSKAAGLDFILAFRWPTQGGIITDVDLDVLSDALRITKRLSLGNVSTDEWYGGLHRTPHGGARQARLYQRIARRHKFDWICCITHRTVCHDIVDKGPLKKQLQTSNVECICLCGYILAGYVYGDVRMPHQNKTSTHNQDMYDRYGLTAATLKGWLSGMDCITGAGFQHGLDGGSRVYAQELGFSGFVTGLPVDLAGTNDVEILKPMKRPPLNTGKWADYQNKNIIPEGKKAWVPT